MADFGRVIAVNTQTVGDELVGAHLADDTVLRLDDVSEFELEDGTTGIVSTSLGLLTYADTDPEADTLQLVDPLTDPLPDEARVELWDSDRGAVSTVTTAYVRLEGSGDDGDPFEGDVPQHLRAYLPDGIRSGPGEIVEVNTTKGAVIDVPGRTPLMDGQVVWNPHSYQTASGNAPRVPTATHTKVTSWVDVETDGITDDDAGSWTVTIPAWYSISAWLTWATNATGRRRLRILINGSVARLTVQAADPDIQTYVEVSTQARLVEGDVVTVWAYQSSGAGLAIDGGAFSLHRISS